MANTKSALKRARQSEKRRLLNKARKTRVKNIIKDVEEAIKNGSLEDALRLFSQAQKIILRTASKGTIHKNKAARKISRLHHKIKRAFNLYAPTQETTG